MIVLVTGGRYYDNVDQLNMILDAWHFQHRIDMIIEGGAQGADRLARLWAIHHGIHCATVNALWDHYKKAAGGRRNFAMTLLKPDVVIAFDGGTGTADMVEKAQRAGIKVLKVDK